MHTSTTPRASRRRPRRFRPGVIAQYLRCVSCFFAIFGGIMLASNTAMSGFGFLYLAISSSHLLIASCLDADRTMIFYSASVFFCVDCLGVYRWLLA